jgi:hypothetical protein
MLSKKQLRRRQSAVAARRRAATLARRTRLADEFREQLRRDLPTPTAAQSALIESAVICRVQIAELSTRYLQGRLGNLESTRLSLARGQLSRLLKQLGLVGGSAEPEENEPGAALAEWARQRRERVQEPGSVAAGASEAQSEAIGARS